MPSLYESYDSLPPTHPYRVAVPLDVLRRFVLQNTAADSELWILHIVLFENILRISTDDEHWELLGIVKAQHGGTDAIAQYTAALWELVDPSPAQARRILTASLRDVKGRRPEHDTGLDLLQKQTNEADDKSTQDLLTGVLSILVGAAVTFGGYCLTMLVSGAWAVAATTLSVGASVVSTGAGLIGSNMGTIAGVIGEVGVAGGQLVAYQAMTQVVNRILVPMAESAVGSIAGVLGGSGIQSILDDLIAQNPSATYEEIFETYRRQNHPEMEDDSFELENIEEEFRLAMSNRPELPSEIVQDLAEAEDIEGAIGYLTEPETESVIQMLRDKDVLSQEENSILSSLITRGRNAAEADAGIGEAVGVGIGEAAGVGIGEAAGVGIGEAAGVGIGEAALSVSEVEIAVTAVSASATLASLAPGIGVILALGAVVYGQIQAAEARDKVIAFVDSASMNFRWRLDDLERDIGVKIAIPVLRTELGTIWDKRTYYWTARDALGEPTLGYLKWRKQNPDIVSPSIEYGAAIVSDWYRSFVSVGGIFVQDSVPQDYTQEQRRLCALLKIDVNHHDEKQYLHTLGTLAQHKATQNLAVFKQNLVGFFKTHERKREETTHQADVAALQFLANQQDIFHSNFTHFVSEEQAPLDVETRLHLESIRNLLENLDGIIELGSVSDTPILE